MTDELDTFVSLLRVGGKGGEWWTILLSPQCHVTVYLQWTSISVLNSFFKKKSPMHVTNILKQFTLKITGTVDKIASLVL